MIITNLRKATNVAVLIIIVTSNWQIISRSQLLVAVNTRSGYCGSTDLEVRYLNQGHKHHLDR